MASFGFKSCRRDAFLKSRMGTQLDLCMVYLATFYRKDQLNVGIDIPYMDPMG